MLALALILALTPAPQDAPVTAQDVTAPDLDPDGPEVPVLELDLFRAEELALLHNLGLRRAQLESTRADQAYLGSWGDFDWTLTGTLQTSKDEIPAGDTLAGASVIESERTSLDLDLTKPLTTGGSFSATFNNTESGTNSQFSFADQLTRSELRVSFTQPLRRGAWYEYATATQRENELTWRLTVEQERAARQDLVLRLRNAYWDLVAAEQQREVAHSSLDLGLELLEKRQRELDAGIGTDVEVLQARAEVATRIEALLRTENDARQRADDLKLLLFDTDDTTAWSRRLVTTTPLPEGTETHDVPTWSQALLTATERRTELRQDRVRIDIARVQHSRTLSERLSGLDLTVTGSSDGNNPSASEALSDALGVEFPGWSVALTYTMPLGNHRANYAERSARLAVRQAVLDHGQDELQVVADVRKAVRDVYYRAEAVVAAQQSLKLARRQSEVEEDRLDEGLSTQYQVLEYQRDLVEAESNERQARVELAKARVALENAQGVIGEADENRARGGQR